MKKRTKQQKIIADYRKKMELIKRMARQNQLLETFSSQQKKSLIKQKTEIINKKIENFSFKSDINKKDNELPLYFKKDLKKTMIISFFIFALEIIIYFAMIKIR